MIVLVKHDIAQVIMRPFREIPAPTRASTARFVAKIDVRDPGQCWIWTASRSKDGYGCFRIGASLHNAHRVAFVWLKPERSKLSDESVLAIRASAESNRALAARFNVSDVTISLVRRGKLHGGVA